MKEVTVILTNIYTTIVEFFNSVVEMFKKLFNGMKEIVTTADVEQ